MNIPKMVFIESAGHGGSGDSGEQSPALGWDGQSLELQVGSGEFDKE